MLALRNGSLIALAAFSMVCLGIPGTAASDQPVPDSKSDPVQNSKPKPEKRTVAILLFEGVELLDFAGPADAFIVAAEGEAFRVVTVAASTEPLSTMGGVTVKPDFTYGDAPRADVLVIPGGDMRNVTEEGVAWIRRASNDSEITMSVCMGAFLLARANLLDGVTATTHHWGLDDLAKAAPQCRIVSDQRFVDNGKIVTTAGVTAGIDGALHVIERLLGADAARWTANEWLEHPRLHSGPPPGK